MSLGNQKINEVLTGLVGSIDNENIAMYNEIINKNQNIKIESVEDFWFSLIYPYDQFLDGLISEEISNKCEIKFLLKYSNFIEEHFEKIIIDKEGSPCSADKSRTILSSLFIWFKNGKHIEFNYEGEYTYHLPKTVFKTHDEIVSFFDALKHLYYGKPEKYLQAMLTLIK